MEERPLRIGTRGSPLALAQVHLVSGALAAAHPAAPPADIVPIVTTGDRITDRPLADIGGKGLFAKEIEAALLAGAIDCAVHSAKDLETVLPDGLVIAAVLPREDPRDALICPASRTMEGIPRGARLGTASVRRKSLVRALRPDLQIAPIRGNIGTRLDKVANGEFDATLLAMAGLIRAGCAGDAAPLAVDDFLPSAGQGIVAVQCRAGDAAVLDHVAPIDHAETMAALRAERAVLAVLDGSCRTPIAAHAEIRDGRITVRGLVADPGGAGIWRHGERGPAGDPAALGQAVGQALRAAAPPAVLAA
ncbi:MAG: hydroxymethylbilane synthase [Rhodospirillaceae bacterium]|nr:hydroxymethylbilane synthase [Rhodospirillaceae bacterium]MYB13684.1 hydroxymethylbilane synthase [Rhodospirillaceae bacterium]MYI48024.1 hydroxymethylbilane synthase [Rhodospirillaceae bacterium]